jgi:nucleotide-binding universal stress UspA family protein
MSLDAITVAVDFGAASDRALEMAGGLARALGATLRLLHVEQLEMPPYFTSEQLAALDRERAAVRAQAHQFLKRHGQRFTTVPFTTVVEDRAPVEAILHHQDDTDLLVMGTNGRRGPRRWWLGSVAEQVIDASRRPVLVVRADSPVPGPDRRFDRILLETGATPSSEPTAAERLTGDMARTLGSTIVESAGRPLCDVLPGSGASLVVVTGGPSAQESLLRTCTTPILFVPPAIRS